MQRSSQMWHLSLVEVQRRFGETRRYHSHRQWRKRISPEYWSNCRPSQPETLNDFLTAIPTHKIRWQSHSFHPKITNSFPESLIEAETSTSSTQTAIACYRGLKLLNSYHAMIGHKQVSSERRHALPKMIAKPVNPRLYDASLNYPKVHFPVLFDKPIFRTQIGTLPKRKLTIMTRQWRTKRLQLNTNFNIFVLSHYPAIDFFKLHQELAIQPLTRFIVNPILSAEVTP